MYGQPASRVSNTKSNHTTFGHRCVPPLAKSPLPPLSKGECNARGIYHHRASYESGVVCFSPRPADFQLPTSVAPGQRWAGA
jgi:hypothetical protein